MVVEFRVFSKILLLFVYVLYASSAVSAQSATPIELVLNQSGEYQIKGGESQFFTVRLGANETARIEIEQRGVDVALAAYKPDGTRFIESESPSGVLGSDLILVTAAEAGDHKIEVTPSDPRAALGKFVIKLAEIRPTVPKDHEINAVSKKITKAGDDANIFRQRGTLEGRRQALEKFKEIIELSKIKEDKVWELVAILSSGLVYEQIGEAQNALDQYLRGLALAREVGNRQYEGSAINNLAVVNLSLGEYETSISYLTQALALQQQAGNRRGQGVVFNNLGTAHLLLENPTKSEEFYRQALAVRRAVKDERGEGFALNNLGQVFLHTGDNATAREFLDQALALRRKIADKQGEAVTLRNLGKLLFKTGNDKDAQIYLTQARTLSNELGDRRVEADTYYWLAAIEARSGDSSRGIEYIEKGLGIIEQIRGEIVNPQLRTGYFSTVPQFFELYITLLVSRSQKNNDVKDVSLALQVSERARARTLVELLQEARINIKKGPDEKALDDKQETLNAKYRDRTTLLSGKATTEQVARVTADINALALDIEDLQIKIRRENPAYADLAYGSALSASEIQELLDDETALVEFKLGDTNSFVWLVTRNSIRVFTLAARRDIESVAANYYKAVAGGSAVSGEVGQLEKRLDQMLFGQIAKLLGKKRIAVVADGVLNLVPFSALPTLSGHETVGLPSAGVLAELRRSSSKRQPSERTIAIFADPVFEPSDSRLATAKEATKERSPSLAKISRDFKLGDQLPRLLASRAEARVIASLVPADQAAINLDFDASVDNAMAAEIGRFRIVHFATHGLLDTQRPESSSLAFSFFDKSGKPRDGLMRLKDIFDLELSSDLVVLSACQTALGKDVRGEGLIGLTRGFMFAGSSRVVASLWKVDDAATAEFMKRFYRSLLREKLTAAAAIKKAQNELKAIPRFRYPFYWAGFTLQGDWR